MDLLDKLPFKEQILAVVRSCEEYLPTSILGKTVLVGATCGLLVYFLLKKRYRLPPGPRGLPLVGNILEFRNVTVYEKLLSLSKKYGPVVTVKVGPITMVALNRIDEVMEALVKKQSDFAGRIQTYSIDFISDGGKSILTADYSPTWKLHRKLATKALRYFMMGSRLEECVERSLLRGIELLKQEKGPFSPHDIITNIIFNIINNICFSQTCDMNDPYFIEMLRMLDYFLNDFGNGYLEDYIPPLRLWHTKKFRELEKLKDEFFGHLNVNIDKHRSIFDKDNLRDFCDAMIVAQIEAKEEEDPELLSQITDLHISQAMGDIFGAGIDTSRFTIEWALLYLARNPHVQEKMHEEIDQVLGGHPFARVSDKSHLPYSDAVLHEVMRLSTVAPIGVPHTAIRDSTIGEYEIPKGTAVLINHYALHRDPAYWDEPEVFKPERYLDKNNKMAAKPESWLPFSAGRRVCLGESVAKPELLLVLVGLLRHFKFTLPPGSKGTFSVMGGAFARAPSDYQLMVESRL